MDNFDKQLIEDFYSGKYDSMSIKEFREFKIDGNNNPKCIINGCDNYQAQGGFVGEICYPCYEMITKGNPSNPSNNFIHKLFCDYKTVC